MSAGLPPALWFAEEGKIDRRKLDDYLLSPTHPAGRHKFRLLRSIFGFEEGDADLLENAIRRQLVGCRVKEVSPTGDTRLFEIVIKDFTGPNERTDILLTAWALEAGAERPHLATARPVTD
ncbi:MAG: DUF6883 domain-containing protein [Rubrobacteraceae bacterium]